MDVDTGEIRVTAESAMLRAVALGSCVAVAVHEPQLKIGGLAHIMLPGKPPRPGHNTKYAEHAIATLHEQVRKLGGKTDNLVTSVVGGANVLQEGDIPDKVIESVLDCLKRERLQLSGMRVGGIERRSVFLNIASGEVFYAEGDSTIKTLLTRIERDPCRGIELGETRRIGE